MSRPLFFQAHPVLPFPRNLAIQLAFFNPTNLDCPAVHRTPSVHIPKQSNNRPPLLPASRFDFVYTPLGGTGLACAAKVRPSVRRGAWKASSRSASRTPQLRLFLPKKRNSEIRTVRIPPLCPLFFFLNITNLFQIRCTLQREA